MKGLNKLFLLQLDRCIIIQGSKKNTFNAESIFIILLVVTVSSVWKDEHLDFSVDLRKKKILKEARFSVM